jgi:hypothetical protein
MNLISELSHGGTVKNRAASFEILSGGGGGSFFVPGKNANGPKTTHTVPHFFEKDSSC